MEDGEEEDLIQVPPPESPLPPAVATEAKQPSAGGGDWPAWYPVIDRELCTHCGKCVEFCLFSVYAKRDGKVSVIAPKNCKNNCPACARVCPASAILFPKHPDPAVNGGAMPGQNPEHRTQNPECDAPTANLSDRLRRRRAASILKK
ncbi:MAG: 4Fe-4S binding protein [Kiritimatiellaeota bacterium]|nr:4Fe-4S binding protein [Kiritimatiellota bacterium]